MRGGFLVDRDGRRKAFDGIDIRLVLQFHELTRIRRHAFHVAALSLGMNGIECEG